MDTLRRTKIVATLGPATDSPEILAGMVAAGLDVARINFSHGTREAQRKRVEMVRHAARQAGRFVGLLADLAGPKIRIESFRDGPVLLVEGEPFALDTDLDPQAGNKSEVGCAYKELPVDVHAGDTLLLADGQIALQVEKVVGTRIATVVRSARAEASRLRRSPRRIWRTSAWPPSSASIIWPSPSPAMQMTCAARSPSCVAGAERRVSWPRSSGTRRSIISPGYWP
jgi:pyruvate kinase